MNEAARLYGLRDVGNHTGLKVTHLRDLCDAIFVNVHYTDAKNFVNSRGLHELYSFIYRRDRRQLSSGFMERAFRRTHAPEMDQHLHNCRNDAA